jgi:hypothetical protein
MIPRQDMDIDYDDPDVVMPWTSFAAVAAWCLLLLVLLSPVCGAAMIASRLGTLARRALGRPVETRPSLEELAARGYPQE